MDPPRVGACGRFCLERSNFGPQSPTACATHVDGDSDLNFENYDLFHLWNFHAQFPDTGRGVHARLWQANWDVDVRR